MHKVVRPFAYAANGYTLEHLNVGAERDFGSATAGLLAEGYIEAVEAKKPAASDDAPALAIDDRPVRRKGK